MNLSLKEYIPSYFISFHKHQFIASKTHIFSNSYVYYTWWFPAAAAAAAMTPVMMQCPVCTKWTWWSCENKDHGKTWKDNMNCGGCQCFPKNKT